MITRSSHSFIVRKCQTNEKNIHHKTLHRIGESVKLLCITIKDIKQFWEIISTNENRKTDPKTLSRSGIFVGRENTNW